ncbi:MAG: DNA repair protein RecN [Atribacterota bacterium]|jgi:DNA repair protein RecN (Recombination protein N)|uniref:DNA repair protein RecN n=1 Tax=Atribacter sp. TaxID=2847780 RepID=UPI001767E75C|nr:DNA repair protein RecN [Atribacterota bacterium]HHT11381.1 DNA repair protein RecN [Candidatus Atribacteria bacterium]
MLRELVIKDFVIVDSQHLELEGGLVAITGETGTGKSLIIDAISLLKGGRAVEGMIRRDRKSALIEGLFDLSSGPDLIQWLEENELTGEVPGEVVLSREIHRDGRNRARINGRSVPVGLLKEAAAMLIDIYGQREHERFLANENQLNILDDFLDKTGNKERELYRQKYTDWLQTKHELEQLMAGDLSRWGELKFAFQEFEEMGLSPEKMNEIEEEFRLLANMQYYCSALDAFFILMEGNESGEGITTLLSRLAYEVEKIPTEGKFLALNGIAENLRGIETELQEIALEVAALRSQLDYSTDKIEKIEKSVAEIERLKRKYRCRTTSELIDYRKSIEEKLLEVERQIEKKKQLEEQLEKYQRELLDSGEKLSQYRQKAAKIMKNRLEEELKQLAFSKVKFEVSFDMVPVEQKRFWATGLDSISFMISLNPGQPLGPVMEVTSGGELSRLVLGIKSIALEMKNLPVMIFDEIDQGVGGKTAFWIGEKLRVIASGRQIVCVTHLPQIACFADQHLRVDKHTDGQDTWAEISDLQGREKRLQELARMMGGEKSTVPALQFAETLMERAGK